MSVLSRRAYRYTRAWLSGPIECAEEEIRLDRAGVSVPATVLRPAGARDRLPGWVVLHGITRPGRAHPQLVRFAHALVSSGAAVIIPEVPEWRELDLDPATSTPTVRAAVAGLRDTGWATDGPFGVVGFSFGAPHAIACTADPSLQDALAGAVGFGGYCDIHATFRFMMTGRFTYRGSEEQIVPDPYGRWIVASNYLSDALGGEAGEAQAALRELAMYAGDAGIPSSDAYYDPMIERLADGLDDGQRPLFELFAPLSGALPGAATAEEYAERLADAAGQRHPHLDPKEALAGVTRPVHVLHGRYDDLVPCSEALALHAALSGGAPTELTITRLFAHSQQSKPSSLLGMMSEVPRFTTALTRVLAIA